MKKNTKRIEQTGINCLERFILKSEVLEPNILKNDKFPTWDGEILLYSQKDHGGKKSFIEGRSPIQVKSSNNIIQEKEKYRVSKSDLENYSKDGGVILIKVVYETIEKYAIFTALLLPIKIFSLLRNNNQNSYEVNLFKSDNIESFERIIKYYLDNRKLQFDFKNDKTTDYLRKKDFELVVKAINNYDSKEPLFSESACVYYRGEFNNLFPTTIIFTSIRKQQNAIIRIEDKVYFTKIISVLNRNNINEIELSSVLRFTLSDGKMNICFSISKISFIEDIPISYDFLNCLVNKNHFYINDKKLTLQEASFNSEIDKNVIQYWKDVIITLKENRIDISNIMVKDLTGSEKEIKLLRNVLVYNNKVIFKIETDHTVFKMIKLLNKNYLLLFSREIDGQYRCINYITSNIYQYSCVISGVNVICSRFIPLVTLFKYDLYKHMSFLISFEDEIIEDLRTKYDNRIHESYNLFILECLKSYDKSIFLKGLIIADKMIDFLYKQNIDDLNRDILAINKIQIEYRKKCMNNSHYEKLIELKNKYCTNNNFLCSIFILLHDKNEARKILSKMTREDRSEFKNWPVYNLLRK